MERKKYTPEFRADAVELVITSKRRIAQCATDLGINEGTLGNWVRAWREEHPEHEAGGVARWSGRSTRCCRLRTRNSNARSSFWEKSAPSSPRSNGDRGVRFHRRGEGELSRRVDVHQASGVSRVVLPVGHALAALTAPAASRSAGWACEARV